MKKDRNKGKHVNGTLEKLKAYLESEHIARLKRGERK